MINIQNLTKSYRTEEVETLALNNVSIEIKAGEFVAIMGPSGCGKSTLLNILGMLDTATLGHYSFKGEDVVGYSEAQLGVIRKQNIGFIFQNFNLIDELSVAENIELALLYHNIKGPERKKRVTAVMDKVGITHRAKHMPNQLSGGQKQRVAIARALCAEPDVLLLDEPLSALDLKLRQHMRTELREIQQRVGITFIYITHDQSEALTMSDHVAVMKAGVIDQISDGQTIYDDPSTPFVASFVGENNVFRGKVKSIVGDKALISTNRSGELLSRIPVSAKGTLGVGDDAMMFIRPEALSIAKDDASANNHVKALVLNEEFEGQTFNVFLEGDGGKEMKMSLVNQGKARESAKGSSLTLEYAPDQAVILPAGELASE